MGRVGGWGGGGGGGGGQNPPPPPPLVPPIMSLSELIEQETSNRTAGHPGTHNCNAILASLL